MIFLPYFFYWPSRTRVGPILNRRDNESITRRCWHRQAQRSGDRRWFVQFQKLQSYSHILLIILSSTCWWWNLLVAGSSGEYAFNLHPDITTLVFEHIWTSNIWRAGQNSSDFVWKSRRPLIASEPPLTLFILINKKLSCYPHCFW